MKNLFPMLAGVLLAAGLVTAQVPTGKPETAPAAPAAPAAAKQDEKKPYTVVAVYPLNVCVVSGEDLVPEDMKTFQADGREFRTCCGNCQKKVEADPAKFAPQLDTALADRQRPHYPLENCPVSKKPLGSMGDPYEKVLDGTLVRMCCKGCDGRATKNAAEITAAIRDASYAAQKQAYPLSVCVVSGEDLDDEPTDTLLGDRLVRTCCGKCAKKAASDPAKYLGKIDAAAAKQTEKKDGAEAKGDKKDGGQVAMPAMQVPGAAAGAAAGAAKAGGCCGTVCVTADPAKGCCADKAGAKPAPAPAGTPKN